jgi:heat shock protein HslJ
MRAPFAFLAGLVSVAIMAPTFLIAQDNPVGLSLPFVARGNEPGWSITLDADKMVFQSEDGSVPVTTALPTPEVVEAGLVYRAADASMTLTALPTICRDTMTGMPSPVTVALQIGSQSLKGCGGASMDLLAGPEWTVTMIGADPTPTGINVTLAFDGEKSSVAGSSGCNRFFGGFALGGEGLAFDEAMAGTRMACEEPKMSVEQSFLALLGQIDRFDIDDTGALVLFAADQPVIRATR